MGKFILEGQFRFVLRHVELPWPGPFVVSLVREDGDMLVYNGTLPALDDPKDVVTKKLVINVDGADVETRSLTLADTQTGEFKVADDAAVKLTLTYIDDAGNESAPSIQEFVAKDTIAPDAPGAFGEITLVREE